jgi:hypothetical protein
MLPKPTSRIDKYFVALLQKLGVAVAEEDKIEIEEGKEEVIRQPCVADTKLSFVFSKKSAKYQILNNTNEVIFASMGDTLDTGIMIPSECARILVVDDTGGKGSNTVTILPKTSTTGDYDVVEVQQL